MIEHRLPGRPVLRNPCQRGVDCDEVKIFRIEILGQPRPYIGSPRIVRLTKRGKHLAIMARSVAVIGGSSAPPRQASRQPLSDDPGGHGFKRQSIEPALTVMLREVETDRTRVQLQHLKRRIIGGVPRFGGVDRVEVAHAVDLEGVPEFGVATHCTLDDTMEFLQ